MEFFRAVPVVLLVVFCFDAVFGGMDEILRQAFWPVVTALALYSGAVLTAVFREEVRRREEGT